MVYVIQVLLTACSQAGIADSLRASCMTYTIAVCTVKTPDDGQRNCPKHVEYYSKNKFEKLVHPVGFITRRCGENNITCSFIIYVLIYILLFVCFWRNSPPPSGPGLRHSRGFQITHIDTPQSVGLLWTSDLLVAETSSWKHTTLTTDIHASSGIRTHSPSKRAASDLRLRPRGH